MREFSSSEYPVGKSTGVHLLINVMGSQHSVGGTTLGRLPYINEQTLQDLKHKTIRSISI